MSGDDKKRTLPTKSFLLAQMETCRATIQQNQGALNLCKWMLENGCYVEEETKTETAAP